MDTVAELGTAIAYEPATTVTVTVSATSSESSPIGINGTVTESTPAGITTEPLSG